MRSINQRPHVLATVRDVIGEKARMTEVSEEGIARQLVLDGHLEDGPTPPLVAEAMQVIEAEDGKHA